MNRPALSTEGIFPEGHLPIRPTLVRAALQDKPPRDITIPTNPRR